jgi:Alpha/beta hydrolase
MRLLDPARIGLAKLGRLPYMLFHPSRITRNAMALLLASAAAITSGGPAHADVDYAPGPNLPAISKSTLEIRYAGDYVALQAAAKEAKTGGDEVRAHTLQEMADPSRQILAFDPQGDGRAIEVVGDLATATRIAVVVPGAGNTLSNFDSVKGPGGGAHAVYQQAQILGDAQGLAVIGWLGYDPPSVDSIHIAAEGHADVGAKALVQFLTQITKVNHASMTLLCHSYGSVVCGQAAHELGKLPVTDIAVFGSPGMGVGSVSDLDTSATVWAGRGKADGIADVPHVQVDVLGVSFGFGDDPVDPAFGAKIFDAGAGGHSDYLRLGDTALKNLTLISLGLYGQVGLASGN